MTSKGRVSNHSDLMYFYERDEVAYYITEGLFYDPSSKLFYDARGMVYDPYQHFNHTWFSNPDTAFLYKNGRTCSLPEQRDEDEKPPKRKHPLSTSGLVNFLIPGPMSSCSKTTFNATGRAIVDWAEQRECNFAVSSMEGPRCMFWSGNLDGHCSCYEAFDDMVGSTVSLDRIETIKRKDEEREKENLPPDHHFIEAEETDVHKLSELYNHREVICLKNGDSVDSIFYYKQWDTFFDGHGRFLKEMTKQKRRNNRDPQDIANSWIGPLNMTKGSNLETENYPTIVEDNSGTLTALEMHKFLHEIVKIANFKAPVIWEVDCDNKKITKITESKPDQGKLVFNDTDL